MKYIDPLRNDSLSDFIMVSISGRNKRKDSVRGGLYSKGSRGSFVREPGVRHRRVVIKAIVMKNNGSQWQERRAKHAEYLQRDGTSIDGDKAVIYGRDSDEMDIQSYLERSRNDPHEFRFILSAEDAGELDLSEFTRQVMSRMEKELGTKLDWAAANHYNTDTPHTHILMRGVDQLEQPLILSKDFISNGMRNIAKGIVTRELGERSEIHIAKEITESLAKRRVSQLDLAFERCAGDSRIFSLSEHVQIYGISIETIAQRSRLEFLSEIGLAKQIDVTSWYLEADLIPKLKEMGFQGDIIKMLNREAKKIEDKECVIVKADTLGNSGLKGTVVARGIANELTDREFVMIDGIDGKAYYVELDVGAENMRAMPGDLVDINLKPPRGFFNKLFENIIEFSLNNDHQYDPKKHLEWVERNIYFPEDKWESGPKEYVEKHLLQLEKATELGLFTPLSDDAWGMDLEIRSKMDLIQKNSEKEQRLRLQINVVDPEIIDGGEKRLIAGKEYTVYKPEIHGKDAIEGVVTSRGVNRLRADFITVQSTDKNDYYVELSRFSEWEKSQVGDNVRIKMEVQSFFKNSDYNIWKCSSQNGLIYDPDSHFEWSKAKENSPLSLECTDDERRAYVDNHVKRMVLLERFKLVTKLDERKWQVDPAFNEKMEQLKKDQEGRFKPRLKIEAAILSASLFGETKISQGRECIVYDGEKHGHLIGMVTGRGISDRRRGSQYLTVKTADEKEYYVQLQRFSERNKAVVGDKITVEVNQTVARDKTVGQAKAVANNDVTAAHSRTTAKSYIKVRIVSHNPCPDSAIKMVGGKECIVFDHKTDGETGLKGRVIGKGLLDNRPNKPFLLVESSDRINYLVAVSVADNNRFRRGDTVNIGLGEAQRFFKKADFAIGRFSAENDNIYDAEKHRKWTDSNLKFPKEVAEQRRIETVDKCVQRMSFLEKYKLVTPVGYRRWEVDPAFFEKMKELEASEEPKFVQPLKLDLVHRPKTQLEGSTEALVPKERTLLDLRSREGDFGSRLLISFQGKEHAVIRPQGPANDVIRGVITSEGVNEFEKRYITIETNDKKNYVVYLSKFDEKKTFEVGKFVEAKFNYQRFLKESDINIASFSASRNHVYDANEHTEWAKTNQVFPEEVRAKWRSDADRDKSVKGFVESHVLRMNFLERYQLVKRIGEGRWAVDPDFLSKSEALKQKVEPGFKPYLEIKAVNNQGQNLQQGEPRELSSARGPKR